MRKMRSRIEGTDNEWLEAYLFYKKERRPYPYFISVNKLTIERGFVSFCLYDGKCFALPVECNRKSKKKDDEALKYMNENYERLLSSAFPDVEVSTGVTIL